MNFVPMPSEIDGAEGISASFACLDMSAKASPLDELDQATLDAILDEIDEPHRTPEPKPAPVAPVKTMAEAIEHSAEKFLSGRKHAVTARVIKENARAAEAGERLLTDRKPVRDRLYQRAHRSHRTPHAAPVIDLDPRNLPVDVMAPIVAEAKERLAALSGAMRANPKSKRYVRLRDRQGEIVGWWASRRMARARYQREPSQAETALVRCLVTGVVEGTFTKRNAQSAFDIIRSLEGPGQPWHRFAAG